MTVLCVRFSDQLKYRLALVVGLVDFANYDIFTIDACVTMPIMTFTI